MNNLSKRNTFFIAFLSVVFLTLTSCEQKQTLEKANDLTISEGFKNPLGFYDASPTFSWKLPVSEKNISQSAYQIVAASNPDFLPKNADLWDSKKQETQQSTFVKYQGKTLQSRQKVYWQIKYFLTHRKIYEQTT